MRYNVSEFCTMLCVESGEKLRLARQYHQPALKQWQLAKIIGVDTSTIGRWESRNSIPNDKIPILSGIFNIIESWWNDGTDKLPIEVRRNQPFEPSNVEAKYPLELDRIEERMREASNFLVPVWTGVDAGDAEECYFEDEGIEPQAIPSYFITGNPELFVLCRVRGMSMYPRIEHSERVLVKLDPDVPPNHLVVARSPDGRNYIKRLVRSEGKLELRSVNDAFSPIIKVDGWIVKGGVTVIWHAYEEGRANIEWNEGAYLR